MATQAGTSGLLRPACPVEVCTGLQVPTALLAAGRTACMARHPGERRLVALWVLIVLKKWLGVGHEAQPWMQHLTTRGCCDHTTHRFVNQQATPASSTTIEMIASAVKQGAARPGALGAGALCSRHPAAHAVQAALSNPSREAGRGRSNLPRGCSTRPQPAYALRCAAQYRQRRLVKSAATAAGANPAAADTPAHPPHKSKHGLAALLTPFSDPHANAKLLALCTGKGCQCWRAYTSPPPLVPARLPGRLP